MCTYFGRHIVVGGPVEVIARPSHDVFGANQAVVSFADIELVPEFKVGRAASENAIRSLHGVEV